MPAVISNHANFFFFFGGSHVCLVWFDVFFKIVNMFLLSIKSKVFWCVSVFPFCIPTRLLTVVDWVTSFLCRRKRKRPPVVQHTKTFKMLFSDGIAALSCHGNGWNVSYTPGKMNRDKSHHDTSNWQLLCLFGVPARKRSWCFHYFYLLLCILCKTCVWVYVWQGFQ